MSKSVSRVSGSDSASALAVELRPERSQRRTRPPAASPVLQSRCFSDLAEPAPVLAPLDLEQAGLGIGKDPYPVPAPFAGAVGLRRIGFVRAIIRFLLDDGLHDLRAWKLRAEKASSPDGRFRVRRAFRRSARSEPMTHRAGASRFTSPALSWEGCFADVSRAARGADLDRRSPGVGGVPRVHIDIEVHVHGTAVAMCAPAVPYVAGCFAVAPRSPERRCRSGPGIPSGKAFWVPRTGASQAWRLGLRPQPIGGTPALLGDARLARRPGRSANG